MASWVTSSSTGPRRCGSLRTSSPAWPSSPACPPCRSWASPAFSSPPPAGGRGKRSRRRLRRRPSPWSRSPLTLPVLPGMRRAARAHLAFDILDLIDTDRGGDASTGAPPQPDRPGFGFVMPYVHCDDVTPPSTYRILLRGVEVARGRCRRRGCSPSPPATTPRSPHWAERDNRAGVQPHPPTGCRSVPVRRPSPPGPRSWTAHRSSSPTWPRWCGPTPPSSSPARTSRSSWRACATTNRSSPPKSAPSASLSACSTRCSAACSTSGCRSGTWAGSSRRSPPAPGCTPWTDGQRRPGRPGADHRVPHRSRREAGRHHAGPPTRDQPPRGAAGGRRRGPAGARPPDDAHARLPGRQRPRREGASATAIVCSQPLRRPLRHALARPASTFPSSPTPRSPLPSQSTPKE